MSKKLCEHKRVNPITGQMEYFVPMKVKSPADLELARICNLEVGPSKLGNRIINKAIMVPCKWEKEVNGVIVYVDTPSDVQEAIYNRYCKDDWAEQDRQKQDGRCPIPGANGRQKRCPLRVPNPAYVPGGNEPKTLPKRCGGCQYEQYRQAHTVIQFSALDHKNDNGEMESFEPPAPDGYFAAKWYLKRREEFIVFVSKKNPKLVPLACLLTEGLTQSEAARELGKSPSTVYSQTKKLEDLATEFTQNTITL